MSYRTGALPPRRRVSAASTAARAFPNFEALWAGGEFAHWARTLLGPMRQALPVAASRKASTPGRAAEDTA
jgi:exodeoxyribonuclease V gamma subunit